MVRPVRINDQDILEAARAVFLSKGVLATTAEVAARAGISEGSLFKRFRSKDELFSAALQTERVVPGFLTTLENADPEADLREVFVQAGVEALNFFRQTLPMMMMSWSHTTNCSAPSCTGTHGMAPPQVMRRSIELIAREIQRGRLNREANPLLVAMSFFGAITNYAFFQVLHREPFPEPETYVRELVDTLWQGIGPRPQPPAPTRKPRTRKHHA